ncbi:copper resistance protein CopC [uncultured Arthrobacter sp.]|uniref:copper resistance CopC family protein n=1 Tax=uncultured Arthrobacter sp. TaxID=114050 RepID=UPI003217D7F0
MKHPRLTLGARLRLAAVAAVLIPAATATPALAHDSLSSTTPAKDAVVTTAPKTVSLTLSEPPLDSEMLKTSVVTVTDGAGTTLTDGKVTVNGPTLSTTIAAGTAGTYTVLWRAVSSDGHPIEGQYSFTVQPAPGGETATPSASPTPSATPSTADPATTPAGTSTPGTVPPPDNANAPLTLGISAAVLAAAVGATLYLRRKRNSTGA